MSRVRVVAALILFVIHGATAQGSSHWTQIGKTGAWSQTGLIVTMNGRFYSVEPNGTLYFTRPDGTYAQIGETGAYQGTKLLAPMNGLLYNVQSSTLYATNPSTGRWVEVNAGDWSNTAQMSAMDGYLWSVELDGSIYRTDSRGNYSEAGRFADGLFFTATGGKLWVVDGDATLWWMTPGQDRWDIVGDVFDFEDVKVITTSPGYLWTLDADGSVWRVDTSGKWTKVAPAGEFKGVSRIIVLDGHLYAIRNGTLYRTR